MAIGLFAKLATFNWGSFFGTQRPHVHVPPSVASSEKPAIVCSIYTPGHTYFLRGSECRLALSNAKSGPGVFQLPSTGLSRDYEIDIYLTRDADFPVGVSFLEGAEQLTGEVFIHSHLLGQVLPFTKNCDLVKGDNFLIIGGRIVFLHVGTEALNAEGLQLRHGAFTERYQKDLLRIILDHNEGVIRSFFDKNTTTRSVDIFFDSQGRIRGIFSRKSWMECVNAEEVRRLSKEGLLNIGFHFPNNHDAIILDRNKDIPENMTPFIEALKSMRGFKAVGGYGYINEIGEANLRPK